MLLCTRLPGLFEYNFGSEDSGVNRVVLAGVIQH